MSSESKYVLHFEPDNELIQKLNDIEDVNDNVNHPSHYTQGEVECIEAIMSSMGTVAYKGYLKGNILKYLWRYENKNGLEDLKKARFYLDRLIIENEGK